MDDFELLAYADGRLDGAPDRRAAVERYLRDSPAAAARVRDWRTQNAALASRYGATAGEPVPARLLRLLDGARDERRSAPLQAAALVALVALVVAAAGAGWFAGRIGSGPGPGPGIASPAGERQAPSAATADGRDDMATVQPVAAVGQDNAAARLRMTFAIPDLTNLGYRLVAHGPAGAGGPAALRLDYVDADGAPLTLLLRPSPETGSEPAEIVERDGAIAARWRDGPLAIEMIIPANGTDAPTLARAVAAATARGQPAVGLAPVVDSLSPPALAVPQVDRAVGLPGIRATDIPSIAVDPDRTERMTN